MIIFNGTGFDAISLHRTITLGTPNFESACIIINNLVDSGCQLTSIHYVSDSNRLVPLPVEAFDGQPMTNSFKRIEQDWKEILYQD